MKSLKNYFNKKTFSSGMFQTIGGFGVVGLLVGFTPASPLLLAIAAGHGIYAIGAANKWQEAATGKPFWKQRTPFYGL